ncbi:MAG: 50S ribosomal protein L4 [Bdellovibrionales bacterium]|nr:50S ribosomal protein L4 [Bdellovibrionales bacterium]
MPTLDVINLENKKVGTVTLSDTVFGSEINYPLVHQVIKAQLADRRQGTAKTKVKSEVRGGGKKPFKQKGTGNARQGSSRSPLKVGGGQNFGPQPRSYAQRTPKEMVRGALRSALSDRFNSKKLFVIDDIKLANGKTKPFATTLKNALKLSKVLIIDEANKNLEQAAGNIPLVRVLRTEGINVYDIVRFQNLVISKRAIEALETRLGKKAE